MASAGGFNDQEDGGQRGGFPFEHDIECQCKCQPQTEAKVDDGGDDDYALVMGRQ